MKTTLHIQSTAQVNTYAHLRHSNQIVIDLIEARAKGCYYHSITSIVLSAFTMEAYCNHIGVIKVKKWEAIEFTPIVDKINFICGQFDLCVDWSSGPWQAVGEAIKLRNHMAHGESETVSVSKTIRVRDPNDDDFVTHAHPKWHDDKMEAKALRCFKGVGSAIEKMHKASGSDDILFFLGMTTKNTSIIPAVEGKGKK